MTMNGNTMKFRPDGSFRLLQVSDPQDMVHPRRAMINMLDRAYDALDPDLVVFTGDNILGNHLLDFGPFRITDVGDPKVTLRQMRRSLRHILLPLERRGIPFAMIYGNHDDMNDVSKQEQFRLYRAYGNCLPMNEDDPAVDCDTYNIPITGTDGRVKWNVYMLDSAWNDETGQHCRIKAETVRWYERTLDALREENGGISPPSLMFLHVPLPQTEELCVPCGENDPGAVKTEKGFVRLDETKATGTLGEPVSPCEDPDGLFEAVQKGGDVRAVISGHDHANCFDGETRGVRLIGTPAASFRCYGNSLRGVRLFILHENAPDAFDTRHYAYDDLCGSSFPARVRYFRDADDLVKQKIAVLASGAAVFAAGAAAAALSVKAKRR